MKTTPKHAWKPGQSGNPAGRPKGAGKIAEMRASIAEHVPAILEQLTQQALEGDVQAARVLLDRAVPVLRAVEQVTPLTLPDGTLTEQGRAVLRSIAAGELGPQQGAQLVAAIGALARVEELDEVKRRLDAIEAAAQGAKDAND